MTPAKIIGWKVNAIGVVSILLGLAALLEWQTIEGIKGILFGLALIAVRSTLATILATIDSARIALSDLRAAIETELEKRKATP
jgi:hypothetical protein